MMFGWWNRHNKRSQGGSSNQIRPFLESLEARDCPSAPQITSFAATVMQGQTVLLAGTVSDSVPSSVNLSFTGVASGSVYADSAGHFQLQTQASALGTVYALGIDGDGQSAIPAQATISVPGPTFSSFMVFQSGPNRAITVSGQVSSGAGLTVNLSGIVSGSTTTGANGVFTFSGTASGLGQVNGSVTDVWGQSATRAAQLTNNAPTITNFVADNTGFQGIWDFEGRVTDEWAPGEIVTFAGLLPLQNVQATVGNDGWFHLQIQLAADDQGLVVASVTDWYGATGQAQCFI